ncbi:hypothetical protein HYPSUDRAFT_44758 [Hypholoma sublateritium FD-334 SS-4]|uniref:Uncharacterized protein n=1 Tax=Hypholoma sublateritium (strain FD-334 SS-4) TaxID=945553 RepID=A0A0D2PFJ2_HYPSF|nr:hypothetical protein HYPSUDRAFT_44758 [Hypholoma sublateritium FD-334 SS-4]
MAWLDVFSLFATIAVFGGIIYGIIFVTKSINEGVASTKESLKTKGFNVTASGMSIKTSKRFDREDYVDATQRGIVKAMQASSFRRGGSQASDINSMERVTSSSSTSSEEKKKKGIFRTKK